MLIVVIPKSRMANFHDFVDTLTQDTLDKGSQVVDSRVSGE